MNSNMKSKKISIKEYRDILKEMLRDLHDLCVENDIKYFVAFGTLIGTVRHDGFIPWDDDIDVCMPRDDYEKFITLIGDSNERYYMLTPSNSKYYFNNFSRFCSRKGVLNLRGVIDIEDLGPFIDVFPLDKITEIEDERQQYYKDVRERYLLVRYSLPRRFYRTLPLKNRIKINANLPKRLKGLAVGTESAKAEKERMILKYNNADTKLLSATFDSMSDKLLLTQDEIDKLVMHKFEDINVLIPSEYDTILNRIYGDYMKLPPVEEQTSAHHFTPYWI